MPHVQTSSSENSMEGLVPCRATQAPRRQWGKIEREFSYISQKGGLHEELKQFLKSVSYNDHFMSK